MEKHSPAQSIVEYTVILSIVAVALIVMQVYMKRGIQSAIKVTADQLSTQKEGEIIDLTRGGYLAGANAAVNSLDQQNILVEQLGSKLVTQTYSNHFANATGTALYNLGEDE